MCEYSERIYNGGKEEGIKIGRLEGRLEGHREGRLEGRQEGRREGHMEGSQEKEIEIMKIIEEVGKQGSAEDVVKEIVSRIKGKKEELIQV